MIEASFDGGRSAAVAGAYQHDRGQRLRMRGLPAPEELAGLDEALGDCEVTVQAQYAFTGDSQTETRLAVWSEEERVWTAAVPDIYMTRNEDVHVYVYVSYGQTQESGRAKTCYEAVFRPLSRPAPGTEVTPDQLSAWDALAQEVNLSLAGVNAAASKANAAAQTAAEAAARAGGAAQTAQQAADCLEERIAGTTATAVTLPAGSEATASIEAGDNSWQIVIGVPVGADGRPGVCEINGIAVPEDGRIELTAQDVGALAEDTALLEQRVYLADIPAAGWQAQESGAFEQSAALEGMLETDIALIDVDMTEADAGTAEALLNAWALVDRARTTDGGITLTCYRGAPQTDMRVKVEVIR